MKKLFLLYVVLGSFLLTAPVVFAHEGAHDEQVEGVLHIEPGDNPIIGSLATLTLSLTHGKEAVDLTTCKCMVTIENQGNILFGKDLSDSIFNKSAAEVQFPFIFPMKSAYTVTLHGSSKDGETFMLSYPVDVHRDSPSSLTLGDIKHFVVHHGSHFIIVLGALVVGSVITIREKKREKNANDA